MSEEKAVAKNISLYLSDWEVVEQETKPLGMTTSAGVRYIIRQWKQLKAQGQPAPRPASAQAHKKSPLMSA